MMKKTVMMKVIVCGVGTIIHELVSIDSTEMPDLEKPES